MNSEASTSINQIFLSQITSYNANESLHSKKMDLLIEFFMLTIDELQKKKDAIISDLILLKKSIKRA